MTRYPGQIWLLFGGSLLGSAGQALVWPFLTITIREQLNIPLSSITLLFTLQSVAGFSATALFSPLLDRFGRKWAMVGGLATSCAVLLAMSHADTVFQWAILLPLYAITNALFRIGSYAMVADLIEPERRAGVYALLRMGDNMGIAAGPALGGFLVATTYRLSYYVAAGTQLVLAVLTIFIIAETLRAPRDDDSSLHLVTPQNVGYGTLLRDRPFLALWGLYILIQIANANVFILLGVYVKENFGITEERFGFLIGINAAMVVVLQYAITRAAHRHPPLRVITLGALFYAAGMAGFALSRAFPAFLVAMVITTLGELFLVPTTTALAATIAPPTMRARYLGVFSLSFRIGAGIGPVLGGVLNDHIAPSATWYGGMMICLVAAAGYALLAQREAAFAMPAHSVEINT